MPRSVLFADPPAFCVAVERVAAPRLRARPVAVAPPAGDRAALLAVSAEAREAGVVRGMPVRLARRHCPDLVLLPPNPELYARASRAVHEILRAYAPVVEPCGWGHAFLDLSGTERLLGPAADVAVRLAREVTSRLRLPLAVGAGSNKLVSQVAAAVLKGGLAAGPHCRAGSHAWELVVPLGAEPAFLAPHHLALLPDLPDPVRARLDEYHLDLIGEVAAIPERALCAVFGGRGRALHAAAHGIDPRPVLPPERRAELHVAHTLATDTNDLAVLHPLLRALAERLGRRLRRQRLAAARLVVEVSWADHTSARRGAPLGGGHAAAALDAELAAAARRAFALACTKRLAVRALALGAHDLVAADAQLDLWEALEAAEVEGPAAVRPAARPERPQALQAALDRIRTRWGVRGVRAAGGERERERVGA